VVELRNSKTALLNIFSSQVNENRVNTTELIYNENNKGEEKNVRIGRRQGRRRDGRAKRGRECLLLRAKIRRERLCLCGTSYFGPKVAGRGGAEDGPISGKSK
jgi:hypothetical protein